MTKEPARFFKGLARNIPIVVGLVLVWRGVWYAIDGVDLLFFEGSHLITVTVGTLIGFLLLYLPDQDFKEIEKL